MTSIRETVDAELRDWSYSAFDHRISGAIYGDRLTTGNHPFRDGERVSTSRVQTIKDGVATTFSGTRYRLYLLPTAGVVEAAEAVCEAHDDTSGIDFFGWCQVLREKVDALRSALASNGGEGEKGEPADFAERNKDGLGVYPDFVLKLLQDPQALHLNMLRGSIAKLTPAQIGHLYRGEVAAAVIEEVKRQNPDAAPPRREEEREAVARIIDPEAFKGWYSRRPESLHLRRIERALTKADAILAALSPLREAEGWKLVPVEPTPEMLAAGARETRGHFNRWEGIEAAYSAMLTAAPAAPPVGEG